MNATGRVGWTLVPSGIGAVDRKLGGIPRAATTLFWGSPGGGKTTATLAFVRAGLAASETVGVVTTHTATALRDHAARLLQLDLIPFERIGQLALYDVDFLGHHFGGDAVTTLASLRQDLLFEVATREIQRLAFDPLDPLVANVPMGRQEDFAEQLEGLFGQLGTTTFCTAYRGLDPNPTLEALSNHAPAVFEASAEALYVRRATWSELAGKMLPLTGKRPFPETLPGPAPAGLNALLETATETFARSMQASANDDSRPTTRLPRIERDTGLPTNTGPWPAQRQHEPPAHTGPWPAQRELERPASTGPWPAQRESEPLDETTWPPAHRGAGLAAADYDPTYRHALLSRDELGDGSGLLGAPTRATLLASPEDLSQPPTTVPTEVGLEPPALSAQATEAGDQGVDEDEDRTSLDDDAPTMARDLVRAPFYDDDDSTIPGGGR